MKYKGIELEGLDKKVKLSHSRVMETDDGTDWIDKLLTCDKAALTPTRFHEVSALSSVINMDYQICNGGIERTSSTATTSTAHRNAMAMWSITGRSNRCICCGRWRISATTCSRMPTAAIARSGSGRISSTASTSIRLTITTR